jgi:hypothetical protein
MKPRKRKPRRAKASFDVEKEVKAIARERVGTVKPARVIVPERDRKKPKYKTPPQADE